MATEGVAAGEKKPKHRRRKHADADRQEHDEPQRSSAQLQAPIAADEFDRPVDNQALREARLKSMSTAPAARKKMKTEYQYTRPVKSPATTTKAKSPRAASHSIFLRPSSVLAAKTKTPGKAAKQKDGDSRGYQSVYNNDNPSGVIRRDFQGEQDDVANKGTKTAREARKSTSSNPTKSKVERRKTEPAVAPRRSSTTATPRPKVKKTTTSVDVRESKSTTDNPPDQPAKAESTLSTNKSPPKPQRNSSVFSLFSKPPPPPEPRVSCLTCGDDEVRVSKTAKLPCDHRMCHSCLKRIFEMSIKDPAHMPPRCCTEKHIALRHVDSLFDQKFKETWNKKFKEYNAKNRIYCPRKGCGEWIQPKHMHSEKGRKYGVCPKCKFPVCAICNQKMHKSRECPKDPAIQQLTEIAEKEGWRKCYNCSAMVELKEGCNHMTCRCTAEFCMVCGLKWKGCDCPWFNYEAVGDVQGDPIRYQQEMDRRREQLQRDEEIARRMAGLDVRGRNRRGARNAGQAVEAQNFEVGNAVPNHMNADFMQQAREALTANYQNAEVAARGLLGGWFLGRENPLPGGIPGPLDEQTLNLQQGPPAEDPAIARRRTNRTRHGTARTPRQ